MRLIYLLIVLLASISTSFAQKPVTPPKPIAAQSLGEISEGKFVSNRLGITLSFPKDYTIVSGAEAELLADAGADILKKGSASEKKIDEAIGRTMRLLVIAEQPVGTPKNAAFEMVAARQQPGVTASMSLLANVSVLKGSPFVLTRNLGTVKLGTNSFAAAELEGTFGGALVKQRMYAIIHRGHGIAIFVIYSTDEQLAGMEKIMATIKLTR
jgi:hypothetical protein